MLIDAHQHFWQIGRHDHAWPGPDLPAIHRDFGPDDLAAVGAPVGLTRSVLVQSQPSVRDTEWLLTVADATPLVGAVVGWVPLDAPNAPATIASLAAHPKLRGLRPLLQNLPEDDWIARDALAPAVEAMIAHGLRFDALVYTRHLPFLLAFARRWPALPVIIDHGAKPPIAAGSLDPWRAHVDALAALPNVTCKLSGLLTEAAPGQGDDALRPYVAHLVAAFGPERLMWGSDWPVLNLAGDYAGWRAMAERLSGLTDAGDLALLFSGTAARVYGL